MSHFLLTGWKVCLMVHSRKTGIGIHILLKEGFYFFGIYTYNDCGMSEGNLYVKN
jgi:hypothetical protein